MDDIRIGRDEFPGITNHTILVRIDDQEFMTVPSATSLADFMHLMLRLWDSEASRYTERDTPIFVGQLVEIRSARPPRRRHRSRRVVAASDGGEGVRSASRSGRL